ncbi:MAG: hypothetical protein ACUVR0_07215 [Candidatus Aminicenantales bacterium]
MKSGRRCLSKVVLGTFLLFFMVTPRPALAPQEYPPKRPIADYLSSFLSRSTKPLGLKEDQKLRQLLFQSPAKWVVRATPKHILN